MQSVAFVDESEPDQRFEPGTYILSATIVPCGEAEWLRAALRRQLRAGQNKVHWHEETGLRRERLVSFVGSLRLRHVVIVRTGTPDVRSERRRRLCLERLSSELALLGIDRIVLESRGPADKLDRSLIDALRAKHFLEPTIRIEHIPGPAEPLLWIPDLLCGAVAQIRRGNEAFLDTLGPSLVVTEI